ncbi:uncharacterized protein A4U43_C03F18660 [Asparagus officinalis]|uniref:Uncharacterized protein n=1 Tax=Asparagus officinalis TaxID=4686 RepID=A0A5P1FB53_ASPOF|nr:uncharacterized protein A4U43_C03F18660 [Asparagus officinalis]
MPPKQAIMMMKKRTNIIRKKKRIYAEPSSQNFEDTNNTKPPDYHQKTIDGAWTYHLWLTIQVVELQRMSQVVISLCMSQELGYYARMGNLFPLHKEWNDES